LPFDDKLRLFALHIQSVEFAHRTHFLID